MLAAFRLRGLDDVPVWYDRLLDVLESGASDENAWPRPAQSRQALVETASLALSLQLSPGRLFDPLSAKAKSSLIHRFRSSLDAAPSANNWVMFPHVISSFLESIGYSDDCTRNSIENSRVSTEDWYRGDGFYTDGPGRTFDYYNAWAFHYYLPLLAHLNDDAESCRRYADRISEYCNFAQYLVDSKGAPVYFGRSLTYRFALVAPFALSTLLEDGRTDSLRNGRLWSAVVDYFLSRGAAADGLLSVGWHGAYRGMAQRYTGPASPYWAAKAFSALLIPGSSDFWKSGAEASIDVRNHSVARIGLVSAKRAGVAMLHNHGTDHQKGRTNAFFEDDALYTRRSYSSRTSPVEICGIPDNSFGILGRFGLSGRGIVRVIGTSGDHSSSLVTPVIGKPLMSSRLLKYGKFDRIGPRVRPALHDLQVLETTVISGGWDVHIFRILGGQSAAPFRYSSWALPGHEGDFSADLGVDSCAPSATWKNSTTRAELVGLRGFSQARVLRGEVSSPFGSQGEMGILDSNPSGPSVLIAVSRLSDITDDCSEPVPSITDVKDGLLVTDSEGKCLHIPQSYYELA